MSGLFCFGAKSIVILYKLIRAETKIVDEASGRIRAVLSTEAEDRDGDIIRVADWDLTHFLPHPVLLASHDYYSLRSQIGEWEDMEARKRDKELVGIARYYIGEGNDEADWGFNLARHGRAAYSVGFIPDMDKAVKRQSGGFEFKGQWLLEGSHVTIPSNPEALQRMRTLGLHPVIDELAAEVIGALPADVDWTEDEWVHVTTSNGTAQPAAALSEQLESLEDKLDRILAGQSLAQEAKAEQARVALRQAVADRVAAQVQRTLEDIHA